MPAVTDKILKIGLTVRYLSDRKGGFISRFTEFTQPQVA